MDSHVLVMYGNALNEKKKYTPAWKQEVKDIDGRKRFHGAFTGGFSAGYYNTVGSKEGWEPTSFVSSRTARSLPATTQISLEKYMDDEDMGDYLSSELVFHRNSIFDHDKLSVDLSAICSTQNAVLKSMGFPLLGDGHAGITSSLVPSCRRSKQSSANQAYRFTHEEDILFEKSYPKIEIPEGFDPYCMFESKTLTPEHPNDKVKKETLSPEAATRALQGFMPFEHTEPGKNERYRDFLHLASSQMDVSQFGEEGREFVRSGQIFQPLHGLMAEKFISPKNQTDGVDVDKTVPLSFSVSKYGHRKSVEWSAFPLLKKRFGVKQEDAKQEVAYQSPKNDHGPYECHDSLPIRSDMSFLRKIYSADSTKKTERVLFRKPQPKSVGQN